MSRYANSSSISYSFGPGPITFAVKWIIIINVVVFVLTTFTSSAFEYFGLIPERVIERGWIWQLATYMFLHGGALHILFNMLGVWMFGVELERRWGTRFFIQVPTPSAASAAGSRSCSSRSCRFRQPPSLT